MLQSVTIEKSMLDLGQVWTIDYARTIDGSSFADRSAISQYAAFERSLTLIGQGYDVMRITEPSGRIIHADAIAEFYLMLGRRSRPELQVEEAAALVDNAPLPIGRPRRSRKLLLVVWVVLSVAATAAAFATLDPAAFGIVGPRGTVAAEPTYR
jgi:hypothetical protein